MGTKHPHYDVIVAWAAGEEIEIYEHEKWRDWSKNYPPIYEDQEYRIKPKRVKKEGWVNVYRCDPRINETKELADFNSVSSRVACIRIEWEEEV